jgi:hypothetical protein
MYNILMQFVTVSFSFYAAYLVRHILGDTDLLLLVLLIAPFTLPCDSVGLASVHHVLLLRFGAWFQHFCVTYYLTFLQSCPVETK